MRMFYPSKSWFSGRLAKALHRVTRPGMNVFGAFPAALLPSA
jgi:hypothetical protein